MNAITFIRAWGFMHSFMHSFMRDICQVPTSCWYTVVTSKLRGSLRSVWSLMLLCRSQHARCRMGTTQHQKRLAIILFALRARFAFYNWNGTMVVTWRLLQYNYNSSRVATWRLLQYNHNSSSSNYSVKWSWHHQWMSNNVLIPGTCSHAWEVFSCISVSYTHLTLPTNREV